MPLLHHQRPRQQRDGSFLDRAHHGADPLSVAMKLGIDRVTSAPFFALARIQQASIPPPPRSVYV